MDNKLITVTSPLLPDLTEFNELLKDIWNRKWITNNGHYHKELEKELAAYLKVPLTGCRNYVRKQPKIGS